MRHYLAICFTLFYAIGLYAEDAPMAELPEDHQQNLAEIFEAHFTAVPYADNATFIFNDYAKEHGLKNKQIEQFYVDWAKQNGKRLYLQSINAIAPTPLASATDPDVASGRKLPPEFVSRFPRLHRWTGQERITEPIPTSEELRIARLLAVYLWEGNWNEIPELLLPHRNSLPPTERDLLIARMAVYVTAIMESQSGYFQGTSVSVWEPLIASENPMYRFVALSGIDSSVPRHLHQYCIWPPTQPTQMMDYLSARQKYLLYEQFFDEPSDIIRLELYQQLSSLPIEEPRAFLAAELERRWREVPEEDRYIDIKAYNVPRDPFAPSNANPAPETIPPERLAFERLTEMIAEHERWLAEVPAEYETMAMPYPEVPGGLTLAPLQWVEESSLPDGLIQEIKQKLERYSDGDLNGSQSLQQSSVFKYLSDNFTIQWPPMRAVETDDYYFFSGGTTHSAVFDFSFGLAVDARTGAISHWNPDRPQSRD